MPSTPPPPRPAVELSAPALAFATERRLATLTTLRPDGTPHVVPVGFTWDAGAGVARVTLRATSVKARNTAAAQGSPGGARTVLCSVEGRHWLTLEGTGRLSDDPGEVAEALRRYAERYERTPAHDPARVVLRVAVDRVMASADLR